MFIIPQAQGLRLGSILVLLLAACGCGRDEPATPNVAHAPLVNPDPPFPKKEPDHPVPAEAPKQVPAKPSPLEKTLRILQEAKQPGVLFTLEALGKPHGKMALAHAGPEDRAKVADAILKL